MPLTLHSLSNPLPIELVYEPDMPLWQYLRDVIAPTAKFALVDGTVKEKVLSKGKAVNFNNKHILLKDFVEDGGKLHYMLPLGPSYGTLSGNACPDGGCTDGCPICLEPTYNFSTSCFHRFHAACLLPAVSSDERCPVCRAPLTDKELDDMAVCVSVKLGSVKRVREEGV